MFSRQAFKALRSSLGNPLRLSSRHVHSVQAPYSGPPSYNTIRQRFSFSHPDPQAYFSRKRQQEARDRGQYVDIHDIGRDPADYDVLITDIKHETLETTIAEELGVPYLSKATEADAKEVVRVGNGYIYGMKRRTIVPLVVTHRDEARWVFFILDSGAPGTYLSVQTCKLLGIREEGHVIIGGHGHVVQESPSISHFTDINLLGTDFCFVHNLVVWQDYTTRRARVYIEQGGKLELPGPK